MNNLYLDIEIARDPTISEELFLLAQEKNPNQINFLPTYNKIISISIGWIKDWVFKVKSLEGTEPEMITELFKYIDKFTLTGFNILGFDLPMITLRAMKHSIPIPPILRTYGTPLWNLTDRFLDIMQVMKITGTRYYNLADMCILLGIPTPKSDMDGSQVQQFYNEGRIEEIQQYCSKDVEASYLMHQKLISLNLL